jgi:hypothetical protein
MLITLLDILVHAEQLNTTGLLLASFLGSATLPALNKGNGTMVIGVFKRNPVPIPKKETGDTGVLGVVIADEQVSATGRHGIYFSTAAVEGSFGVCA